MKGRMRTLTWNIWFFKCISITLGIIITRLPLQTLFFTKTLIVKKMVIFFTISLFIPFLVFKTENNI